MSKVGGYLAMPNTTCSGHPTKSGRAKIKAAEYDANKILEYIQEDGLSQEDAEAKVNKHRKGKWKILDLATLIHLCDGRIMPLKEVIKQRIKIGFADPINGKAHGLNKAILFFDKYHKPYIRSFSHGGFKYKIEGYEYQKNNINQSALQEATQEFDFQYSSLLPGAGKSHWIIEQIKAVENANKKYLICLPSLELIAEYEERLLNQNPRIIKSGNAALYTNKSNSLIANRIKSAVTDRSRLIIITHNALIQCIDHELFKQLQEYNLVIDETFYSLIYKFSQFRLKNALLEDGILNRLCEAKHYKSHDVLTIRDKGAYAEFCKNKDGLDTFDTATERKILESIADYTQVVWILNMKRSKLNVLFVSIFNFEMLEYFESRTLLGACCEHTALYCELSRVFNMNKITIKKDPRRKELDYSRIIMWPLSSEKYSKNRRDYSEFVSLDGSKTFDWQQYTNHVSKVLGFQAFLRICNKDDYETVAVKGKNTLRNQLCLSKEWVRGRIITSNCAGRNDLSHIHNMAFVAAFNFPSHINAFFDYRLPGYDYWFEHNALKAMQCIMRTSARDVDSKETVNIIVSDLRTAEAVQEALHGQPKIRNHPYYDKFKKPLSMIQTQGNVVEINPKSALKRGPKVRLTEAERKENRRLYDAKRNAKRKLL